MVIRITTLVLMICVTISFDIFALRSLSYNNRNGDPKFFENGDFKPFHGLTCIVKIKVGSPLNDNLRAIQDELKDRILAILMEEEVIERKDELKQYVRFLPPPLFPHDCPGY